MRGRSILRRRHGVSAYLSERDSRDRRLLCERLEERTLLDASLPIQYLVHDPSGGNPYGPELGSHFSREKLAPLASSGPVGISPLQMRVAYGVNLITLGSIVGDGTGQTIAVIDAYDDPALIASTHPSTDPNFVNSDLYKFDHGFSPSLPDPPSFIKLNQTGGSTLPPADTEGWAMEEALDVEWAHAMAPNANIIMIEANSGEYSAQSWTDMATAVDTARHMTVPSVVSVISMSYGWDESFVASLGAGTEVAQNPLYTTPAGHAGVAFLASTGDDGAPGGYPAYSPNVVAVGGTTLTVDSLGNYISESGWSGSGGGQSGYESEPSYQNLVQTSGKRAIPDIAFDADPASGAAVYDSYDGGPSTPWFQVGGTSLSSPCMAGLVAIGDQLRISQGLSAMDGPTDVLPLLYMMGGTDLHDITSGNNGYPAGTGWDMVTGRGTPKANKLVPDFVPATPQGAVAFSSHTYQVGDTATITVRDSNTASCQVTIVSASGDSETLTPASLGSGVFQATIATSGAAIASHDGVLEVIPGDTITVTYNDADDGTGHPITATDQAAIVAALQITTTSPLPAAAIGRSYSATLAATGGVGADTWSVPAVGNYVESDPGTGWLGSGTAQGWHDDDASWTLTLPWSFPYYGASYGSVWVSSNGFLDFTSGLSPSANSRSALEAAVRIAPLWEDLTTTSPGDDIFVTSNASYVAVRWAAHTYSGYHPVNVEAVLYPNGDIKFNYGAGQIVQTPTIGVSAGDNVHYSFSSRDGASSIPANVSSLMTHASSLPAGLSLSTAGVLSGTPSGTAAAYNLTFAVTDSGSPQHTALKSLYLDVIAVPTFTLTVPANASEGDGTVAGSVSLSFALSADLVVSLSSGDASRASVPATVTIPAGLLYAPVPITIADNALLDGVESVTVTATATGYSAANSTITVHDNETATLTVTLPASAHETAGVITGQSTVRSSQAPTRNIVVQLASSYTAGLTVPATVTLLAGQTTAPFDVTMHDDYLIEATRSIVVTATVEKWTSGSATLSDLDDDRTITVLLPSDAWEGQGVLSGAGTVRLGGAYPTSLVVGLASNDSAHLTVPASVTIPANQTTFSFDLSIGSNLSPDRTQTVTVTASASTFTNATKSMVVHASRLDHFAWDAIASPEDAQVAFLATARAKNLDNETIPTYAASVALSATGDHGADPATPASCAFVGGVWTGSVTLAGADTNVVLGLNDGAGHTGVSSPFTVQVHGPLAGFEWSKIASPQFKNVPFTATARAVDALGATVSDYSGQPTLTTTAQNTPITIGTGSSTWTFPLHTFYHDARTQVLYTASELGSGGAINALSLNVTTVPGQVMNNWTIRMKHTSLGSYSTLAWEGPTSGWTTVYQANQSITTTGWVTFTFTTPFQYDGVDNLMIDFSYNNSSYTSNGYVCYTDTLATRSLYYYTDSGYGDPLTWSGTSSPAPYSSTYVPNIQLTKAVSLGVTPTTATFVQGVWTGSVTVSQMASGVYLQLDGGSGHTGLSNAFNVGGLPSTPSPANGATGVSVSTTLSWAATGVAGGSTVDAMGSTAYSNTTSSDGTGDVYQVTTATTLSKIEMYLGITTSTDLRFFVYESTTQSGMFTKVLDQDVPVSGTGTGWYGSGPISVSLVTGRFYYIGASRQGTSTYYYDSTIATVSFGTWVDGGHTIYPPPTTTYTPGGYLAYYQRLTTGAETYDVYLDTVSPPATRIYQDIGATTCAPPSLANNTTYYWQIVAHNFLGAAPSPIWHFATVPSAPSVVSNVACGNPAHPLSTVFTFTNSVGWGSGGADHYHYLWDQNPTDTLSGSEAAWQGGTLSVTSTAPGEWYLHLLSHSSSGSSGGEADFGPYCSLDVPVVVPEPSSTSGTTNTLTWAAVPGATAYYAEADDDADFSSPEFNSGWITGTQYTFAGLTSGSTYNYHVKARMSVTGASGSWTQTSQADFSSDTLTNTSATAAPGDVVLAPSLTVLFAEDFENGNYNGWVEDGGSYTRQVTTATAAHGVYSLTQTGGSNYHFDGVSHALANITPDHVDFWVRSASTSTSDGYFVLGTGPDTETSTAVFFYMKSDGTMGIYTSSTWYSTPCVANQWYHISFAFNWTAKTVDYYANGTLVDAGLPFRNTLSYLSEVYLYNFDYSQAWWDDISMTQGSGGGYASPGSVTSTLIAPAPFANWNTLAYNTTTPAATTLGVDVLSASGTVLATNVASGSNLAALGITQPSVKLRANLASSDSSATPALHDWTLTWQATPNMLQGAWSDPQQSTQGAQAVSGEYPNLTTITAGNAGSTFIVTVNYNEDMYTGGGGMPTVALTGNTPAETAAVNATLTNPAKNWVNARRLEVDYTVRNASAYVPHVNIGITGGYTARADVPVPFQVADDFAINTQVAPPTVIYAQASIQHVTRVNPGPDGFMVHIHYDPADAINTMLLGSRPTITFVADTPEMMAQANATLIPDLLNSTWSGAGKDYIAYYNVVNTGAVVPNVDMKIAGAQGAYYPVTGQWYDQARFLASGAFTIDMTTSAPLVPVQSTWGTYQLVTNAAALQPQPAYWVRVNYAQSMSIGIQPTVALTGDTPADTAKIQAAMHYDHGTWTSSQNYMAYFTVSGGTDVPMTGVHVAVEGAHDLVGNLQVPYLSSSAVFNIDTHDATPSLSSVTSLGSSRSSVTAGQVGSQMYLEIVYSQTMDISSSPTIQFLDAAGHPTGVPGATVYENYPASYWGSDHVYWAWFDIQNPYAGQTPAGITIPKVGVQVTDARDITGRAQTTYQQPFVFDIDTLSPDVAHLPTEASVSPNLAVIRDANVGPDKFLVRIDYDRPMWGGANPVLGFVPDPGTPANVAALANTLASDPDSSGWGNYDSATHGYRTFWAWYTVTDVDASIPYVGITIKGAVDTAGHPQSWFEGSGFSIAMLNTALAQTDAGLTANPSYADAALASGALSPSLAIPSSTDPKSAALTAADYALLYSGTWLES